MNQKLTIGRIVRYIEADGSEVPAIVTKVRSETAVTLTIFPAGAIPWPMTGVVKGEAQGNWRWPQEAS